MRVVVDDVVFVVTNIIVIVTMTPIIIILIILSRCHFFHAPKQRKNLSMSHNLNECAYDTRPIDTVAVDKYSCRKAKKNVFTYNGKLPYCDRLLFSTKMPVE